MAITPSFVQVAPDSTGKKIDNVEVVTAAGTVERQVVVIADPEDPTKYVAVDATGLKVSVVTLPTSAIDAAAPASVTPVAAAINPVDGELKYLNLNNAGELLTAANVPTSPVFSGAAPLTAIAVAAFQGASGELTYPNVSAAGNLKVDGSTVTQPVSAAALPLPTGASTEATLTSVKAKTDNIDVALSTFVKDSGDEAATKSVAVQGSADGVSVRTYDVGVNNTTAPPGSDALQALAVQGVTGMVPVQVTGTSGGGLALESGNLSSIKTNTDGLKAAAAGAYVRQDSTATIAKESGGNLAALAATRVAVGSDTNPFALVVQGDTDGTPLPMTGSVIARLFDPTTATYFTIKDGNVLPLPTDHAVVVTLRDNPTIASITNPVAIKASVVDEGQPDYVADGSQQVLTQTIDGRLRVDTDKKLADSIEVLREELREMRTLFEMAFT